MIAILVAVLMVIEAYGEPKTIYLSPEGNYTNLLQVYEACGKCDGYLLVFAPGVYLYPDNNNIHIQFRGTTMTATRPTKTIVHIPSTITLSGQCRLFGINMLGLKKRHERGSVLVQQCALVGCSFKSVGQLRVSDSVLNSTSIYLDDKGGVKLTGVVRISQMMVFAMNSDTFSVDSADAIIDGLDYTARSMQKDALHLQSTKSTGAARWRLSNIIMNVHSSHDTGGITSVHVGSNADAILSGCLFTGSCRGSECFAVRKDRGRGSLLLSNSMFADSRLGVFGILGNSSLSLFNVSFTNRVSSINTNHPGTLVVQGSTVLADHLLMSNIGVGNLIDAPASFSSCILICSNCSFIDTQSNSVTSQICFSHTQALFIDSIFGKSTIISSQVNKGHKPASIGLLNSTVYFVGSIWDTYTASIRCEDHSTVSVSELKRPSVLCLDECVALGVLRCPFPRPLIFGVTLSVGVVLVVILIFAFILSGRAHTSPQQKYLQIN